MKFQTQKVHSLIKMESMFFFFLLLMSILFNFNDFYIAVLLHSTCLSYVKEDDYK